MILVLVGEFVGDVLPYPALLSAPVTLTLALSRRGSFAQPVSTSIVGVRRRAIPLCPSDISPASGGNPGVLQRSRRAGEGIYPIASLGSVVFNPLSRGRALFRLW